MKIQLVTTAVLAAFAMPCVYAQNGAQNRAQNGAQNGADVESNLTAGSAAATVATDSASETSAPCKGSVLAGSVHDSTLALIPGATLTLDGTQSATSGSDGRFRFPCVVAGQHHLTVTSDGFATRDMPVTAPHVTPLDVTLALAQVQTEVNVDADAPATPSTSSAGVSQTLSGKELQRLADDPDDLLRELQQLAAATGGNPANTTIAVDGFQGSSALPPKSSIAYIKINPDQFSAEYREPPFDGGRVEVYTKPGQKAFHGALFTTNGSPFENAKDPFSTSKAAIGKQRYGFELTGPVRPWVRNGEGSDFSLTLEHRSIDNFAVVNAFTLDGSGNQVATVANVATPQRLWLGTARVDWQLGPKNTLIASYSANVNNLLNLGVGGSSLASTGYNASRYEHMFRVSEITTVSTHLMHEARLSLRFDGETDTALSTAPQIEVSGAFTGGGASIGNQRLRELNIEYDDDAILTTKNHTLKFGAEIQDYIEHQQLTTGFNGTYTFGSIQQYAAGTPETYTSVAGSPGVDFSQTQNAFFVQDDWNIGHNLHVAYGVRYFVETNPNTYNSLTPRVGILWSPTKKGTWTLHAHYGLFSGRFGEGDAAEVLRENGTGRVTSTIYNPVYGNPYANATPIQTVRQLAPHLSELTWGAGNIGGTRTFPHGWNISADYYLGRIWNDVRSENINSPLNGLANGPRPGPANLNILQLNNSGQGNVNATFVGIENHTYKRLQFFFGGVRVELTDDTDDNEFFTPQSSTSNVGEFAHPTGQQTWNLFGNGTLTLPGKVQLSTDFHGGGDSHFNITTGFDNNGDGDFNDRPQYATPGQSGAIQTPYGLLVPSGGTGVYLPRNRGQLPWVFFVDTNLQRSFALTHNKKADHPQTLVLNVRSSNLLNHLNVTGEDGVLGSPQFDQPITANNGRRIEAGARYTF